MSACESLLNRRVLQGHTSPVDCCVFTADGRYIITSSDDGSVKIWNVDTTKCVHTIAVIGYDMTAHMVWPDPRTSIATIDAETVVRVWNVFTGKCVYSLQHRRAVDECVYSPDGSMLVTVTHTIARLWDLRTGDIVIKLDHYARIQMLTFSSDGTKIVTVSQSYDVRSVVTTWDSRTGVALHTWKSNDYVDAGSYDGSILVTSNIEAVTVRGLPDDNVMFTVNYSSSSTDCALSKDGSYLAIRSAHCDTVVTVWNTCTGRCMCILNHGADEGQVIGIYFPSDNVHVITITRVIKMWDLFSGTCRCTLPETSCVCSTSEDGLLLAFDLDDNTVCVVSGPLVRITLLVFLLTSRRYSDGRLWLPDELWSFLVAEFF